MNFLKQKSIKPKVRYDIIKTLSHGYSPMGPMGNAICAVPSHSIPWDMSYPIPMDKPADAASIIKTQFLFDLVAYLFSRHEQAIKAQ